MSAAGARCDGGPDEFVDRATVDRTPRPGDMRYSEEHLWFRRDNHHVTVGVAELVTRILTWVTVVVLPEPGIRIEAGEELVQIDTQKALVVIPTPVALDILERNEALAGDPMLVRMEGAGRGWLVRARMADKDWARLLDEEVYNRMNAEL